MSVERSREHWARCPECDGLRLLDESDLELGFNDAVETAWLACPYCDYKGRVMLVPERIKTVFTYRTFGANGQEG